MAGSKVVYTISQIAQHKSKQDCWLVVNGRVLNVTKFLEAHPGGDDVLLEVAGKDATKEFKDVGHTEAAQLLLAKYQIGSLQGSERDEVFGGTPRGRRRVVGSGRERCYKGIQRCWAHRGSSVTSSQIPNWQPPGLFGPR
ncbi:unnamed protein product [Rhodiola kirilowii]